jgi:hypothetical protein
VSLFQRLWQLQGTVGRATYALGGLLAFGLKFGIDWSVAHYIFHRPWSLLNYWYLLGAGMPTAMAVTLIAIAIPFVWFGITMTLLRLRDVGAGPLLTTGFFVPVFNVGLFALLSLLPPGSFKQRHEPGRERAIESALIAVLLTALFVMPVAALSIYFFELYGIGLFVGLPFCIGFIAALVYARRAPGSKVRPWITAYAAMLLVGGVVLAVRWEGVVCLVMVLPLALGEVALGVLFANAVCNRTRLAHASMIIPALLPLMIAGEASMKPAAPLYEVRSSIEVDAPPAVVWKNVIEFPEITEEPELIFRAGIAYPLRARIVGRTRYCEFTTGAFVEPIDVWDAPRRLSFSVTRNPDPMRELSPYGRIDAPHLHGFLTSKRGQFDLQPLDGGRRTRLTGTTWYQHNLWPAAYWRLWSDEIIHRIHMRVLRHIRNSSEKTTV